mmetsp:Transcript_77071/g.239442  ORF Transcript_77071/g.239442 Transcript_77071/m.239442 type:complete len:495 (-) Transcript_77071:155-1639(-)
MAGPRVGRLLPTDDPSRAEALDQPWLRKPKLPCCTVCWLLSLQGVVCSAALVCCYLWALRPARAGQLRLEALKARQMHGRLQALYEELNGSSTNATALRLLQEESTHLSTENQHLRESLRQKLLATNRQPYKDITSMQGHKLPEMYNEVKEKTIWAYWYDAFHCRTSTNCVLPPVVQLCKESIERNKGGFDFRLVHRDEVDKYVSWFELPVRWKALFLGQKKDALMNALLARYGGVALDLNSILLQPLDDHWDEMVRRGATFRGYMYRINGQPWRHPEAVAVWYLMSRREGVFSTAVRSQVIGMGDMLKASKYRISFKALGDQTILPILSMYNYSLPKCHDDPTVVTMTHQPGQHYCPEHEQPPWYRGITGPQRNDTRLILRDPRDGPHLPFALLGMATWHITDNTTKLPHSATDTVPGAPMHNVDCASMKQCWEDVVLRRFRAPAAPGEARLMSAVPFFDLHKLKGLTREHLLSDKRTYFYNLLRLSGIPSSI